MSTTPNATTAMEHDIALKHIGESNPVDTTGLCLLSLDGGVVRGFSSLYVLKSIMDRLNHAREQIKLPPVKPCEVFDLIGGTSTGGLIAIMLGRLEMDIDECIDAYSDLATAVFGEKPRSFPVSFEGDTMGRFYSAKLENAIRKVVEDSASSKQNLLNDGAERGCRTFVCTADRHTKDIVRLRSYSLPNEPNIRATICQAALATCAVTNFFEPVSIGDRSFADGGLGANNPVDEVEGEASNIWCSETGDLKPLVKCFISIGTGNPGKKLFKDGIVKFLGQTLVRIATETENTERKFIARWARQFDEKRYFRFNVEQGLQEFGLEEYKQKRVIEAATEGYLTHRAQKFRVRDCIQNLRLKEFATDENEYTIRGIRQRVKNSYQSSEEADPTSEELTENYPPSAGAISATKTPPLSQGFWSSWDARDTVNASTTGTSVKPGRQEMSQDSADIESIYTSDVPRSPAYVRELARSFFRNTELPDTQSLRRIRESLPDLLRGFAQVVGGENHASLHLQVMKFIYKKRMDIAVSFEHYYLDDNETSQRRRLNEMSLDERVDRWQVDQVMDDPNSAIVHPDDIPHMNDDAQSDGDDDYDDDDEASVDGSRFVMYRNVVTNSIAFQWLLGRLHREVSLTMSEANSFKAISARIRQVLYSRRENRLVSSQKGPPKCSAVFQSDWNPLAFTRDQEYKEEPGETVECAIIIVQDAKGDVEAMPCSEYVNRTWPLFGEIFMGLLKHTVRSTPGLRCSAILFDMTKVTAWVEPSGCFYLEAAGVAETIVEVGEVFAFITAALRSAQGDSVASVTPIIKGGAKASDQTCIFTICLQHSHGPLRSTGQCWQDLFRNPAVVLGFPVRRRQPDQGPGLEISLATLAMLVGTRRIVVFCGRVFLQGFCTMLVPTRYAEDTVHWHVLFNENGNRISFTDFRVRETVRDFDLSKHLTLSGVETARHIVGWCEQVRNYAGSREASYDIHQTGLPQPDSRFALDRVSVSAGRIVSVGASVAIGKKDKPARAAKTTDYHKQIEWAEERFIVLYDCKDRRAWLIDGLSALLHLVRGRLAHRRKVGREVLFGESDIKEPDVTHTGKAAANTVLRNRANMDLKVYEKWNRVVEETSQKGEEPPETSYKTQKTWEQLPDLVGDIYTTLGALFDIQTDTLSMDGFGAKVHKSPRRNLEGWDFQQVAAGADPLLPKAALLRDVGLGWVDLVRAINAITLFGVGFGEILQPVNAAQVIALGGDGDSDSAGRGPAANIPQGGTRCDRWATLPKGKDLLATTTPVILDIMESVYREPDNEQRLRELSTGIYWHSPDKTFEDCHCGDAGGGMQCDRVQVLLPTKFPKLFTRGFRSPPEPLPAHGAVIFGHSVRFPLFWKREACSVPTERHLQPPELTSQSSKQSDSGLGTSVASSSVYGESSSQSSGPRPSTSESTHKGASSHSFAPATGFPASGKGKSAENIVKRLIKKTRPGAKSGESGKGSN